MVVPFLFIQLLAYEFAAIIDKTSEIFPPSVLVRAGDNGFAIKISLVTASQKTLEIHRWK